MMILVGVTKESGIFQFLAIKAAKAAKGSPWGILIMLSLVTAVRSTFLDNVTTVLLVVRVTLLIADELTINPYPLLFAEINASNTGGAATLTGDPPNIMVASATGLTFMDLVIHMTPVAMLAFSIILIPQGASRLIPFLSRQYLSRRAPNRHRPSGAWMTRLPPDIGFHMEGGAA